MANPNINSSGLVINGLSAANATIGTSATSVLTVPTAHLYRLSSINFTNVDSSARTVTWQVVKSGGATVRLGYTIPIGVAGSLLVDYVGLNLQDGDILQVSADLANKVEVIVTFDDMY